MATHYLACDLGAESGRLMLGTLEADRLRLEEIHRFANTPVKKDGSLFWNIPELVEALKAGLRKSGQLDVPISSLSCDTWGVDYLLFDAKGDLISPTYHYRDARTAEGLRNASAKVSWETIFEETGIQHMPINTLFQLAAESPQRLAAAKHLLLIGDGFHYMLSGIARAEESLASTSQLYNPRTRNWSEPLIDGLGLPAKLFPPIVSPGTKLGPLRDSIAKETGLPGLEIVATCTHDTGAAVAAVPSSGSNWAYISSGTWSLMGVEVGAPIITGACRDLNFTNEIGFGGSVRLLKNIIGLWLVQECRREWAKQGQHYDYAALTELATAACPFQSLINPADPRFLRPDEMPAKIAAFCRKTGQPEPASPGAAIRCALESLALLYRRTLKQLEQLTGSSIEQLHIVGGGSKNNLLNQFTADALGIPVIAGPVEATAAGNVLVQAIALGDLPSLSAGRNVIRNSFETQTFHPDPKNKQAWDAATERFLKWF